MDDDLTKLVSEDLRRQAADLAATRGVAVESVVREAIAQYVSVYAPEQPQLPVTAAPRTTLGARLRVLRSSILDDEAPPLGWEELQREIADRRGERDHAPSYLR
jgi:hypothetical protein